HRMRRAATGLIIHPLPPEPHRARDVLPQPEVVQPPIYRRPAAGGPTQTRFEDRFCNVSARTLPCDDEPFAQQPVVNLSCGIARDPEMGCRASRGRELCAYCESAVENGGADLLVQRVSGAPGAAGNALQVNLKEIHLPRCGWSGVLGGES